MTVLSVVVALGAGYRLIEHYAVRPSYTSAEWNIETLDDYQPTLLLDLNSASSDSLEMIPGIGPVLAQRIVAYRKQHGAFAAVDSLLQVSGIGEIKLEQIKPYFRTVPL